jgi:hypothetical protein
MFYAFSDSYNVELMRLISNLKLEKARAQILLNQTQFIDYPNTNRALTETIKSLQLRIDELEIVSTY